MKSKKQMLRSPLALRITENGEFRAGKLIALVLVLTACGQQSLGAPAEIKGGFDAKTRTFTWTVRNLSRSPIVQIEFPHFHADALIPPEGWVESSTYLVTAEVPTVPGVCTATAEAAGSSILTGKSRVFAMRLSTADAEIGKNTVTLRFGNGQVETISGVELPVKPGVQGFGSMPAIALTSVFVLYVLWRTRRGKRTPTGGTPPPQDEVI